MLQQLLKDNKDKLEAKLGRITINDDKDLPVLEKEEFKPTIVAIKIEEKKPEKILEQPLAPIKSNLAEILKQEQKDDFKIKTKEDYETKVKELSILKKDLALKVMKGITNEEDKLKRKEERKILREKIKRYESDLLDSKEHEVDYNKLTRSQLINDILTYAPLGNMKITENELKIKSDKQLADLHVIASVKLAENCGSSAKFITTLYILMIGVVEQKGEVLAARFNSSLNGLSKNCENNRKTFEEIFSGILKENPHLIRYFNIYTQLGLITFQMVYMTIDQNKKK
jgi:hypothetical protein